VSLHHRPSSSWMATGGVEGSTCSFEGMVFSEGLLVAGTFLDEYMKGSWSERLEHFRTAKTTRFFS